MFGSTSRERDGTLLAALARGLTGASGGPRRPAASLEILRLVRATVTPSSLRHELGRPPGASGGPMRQQVSLEILRLATAGIVDW